MIQYNNYCTAEQTKRAYKLGAPIIRLYVDRVDEILKNRVTEIDGHYYFHPTTQQMMGWLREEYGIQAFVSTLAGNTASVYVSGEFTMFNVNGSDEMPKNFDTYQQAELTSIDAALDYIEKILEKGDNNGND